jgi:hypothetical protein
MSDWSWESQMRSHTPAALRSAVRRPFNIKIALAICVVGLLVAGLACGGEAPASEAQTPSDEATGPTATPTPSPVAESTSQPGMSSEVDDLMALVPADYDVAVFVDLRSVLADPNLTGALDRSGVLGDLGRMLGFPEGVDALVLAWAFGLGDRLWVLRGALDTEELVNSLKAGGAVVELESYGAFEIWKVETRFTSLTQKLTIVDLEGSTVLYAQSIGAEGLSGADSVKAVVDTAKGSKPGILSDDALEQLFESAPLGFHMMVNRTCDIDDCAGFVVSHTAEGEGLVFNMVLGLSDPVTAQGLISGLTEEMLTQGNIDPSDILEATAVGGRVRLRVKADANKISFMSAEVPQ